MYHGQYFLPSYSEEHFHEPSTLGRRNPPLCNVRGQATRGQEKPRPINAPFLRPQRYKFVSDILSISMAYTFMTGFAKDDHGSLQTSQVSISLLGKPEEYKIHKAKMREMRGQKTPEELRGRSVGVFHQDACLFLPGMLTPEIPRSREAFSIGCLGSNRDAPGGRCV